MISGVRTTCVESLLEKKCLTVLNYFSRLIARVRRAQNGSLLPMDQGSLEQHPTVVDDDVDSVHHDLVVAEHGR